MKSIEALTFADDFIFGKVLEDTEICKGLLERLLQIKIKSLSFSKLQEVLNPCYEGKGIRFDVFAADENRNFDIEIQIAHKEDLPLRMRYYQSLMDVDTLLKGSKYSELKESYVIFICLFDPIGAGLPVYTISSKIAENGENFNDRTIKVLYNVNAFESEENKNIRAILEYIKTQSATDDWTRVIESRVAEIKAKQKQGREFMTYQMFRDDLLEEGEMRGIKKGILQGARDARITTARNFLTLGVVTPEQIAQATELSLAEVEGLRGSEGLGNKN